MSATRTRRGQTGQRSLLRVCAQLRLWEIGNCWERNRPIFEGKNVKAGNEIGFGNYLFSCSSRSRPSYSLRRKKQVLRSYFFLLINSHLWPFSYSTYIVKVFVGFTLFREEVKVKWLILLKYI